MCRSVVVDNLENPDQDVEGQLVLFALECSRTKEGETAKGRRCEHCRKLNGILRKRRNRISKHIASVDEDPIAFLKRDRGPNVVRLIESLPLNTLQQLVLAAIPALQQTMTINDYDYKVEGDEGDEGEDEEDEDEEFDPDKDEGEEMDEEEDDDEVLYNTIEHSVTY